MGSFIISYLFCGDVIANSPFHLFSLCYQCRDNVLVISYVIFWP